MIERQHIDLFETTGTSPPSWANTADDARKLASDVARELAIPVAWSYHATFVSRDLHLEVEGELPLNPEPEVEGGGGSEPSCLSARGRVYVYSGGASCTSYVYKRACV